MQRKSCIAHHACQLLVRKTDADQTSSALLNEYKYDVALLLLCKGSQLHWR